ncbi:hypothetical protein BH10PSE12_BH10PSE12_24560 [soil metagenome]
MSASDFPAKPSVPAEPGRDAIAAARAFLAEIETRVFPGSQAAPLYAQAGPIRQVVTRLFGDAR